MLFSLLSYCTMLNLKIEGLMDESVDRVIMANSKELIEELNSVFKGKGMDALLPPLIFTISNNYFTLLHAIVLSIFVALFFALFRIIKKQSWFYALGGLLGVIFASSLAYFANNASSFFLPGLVSSVALVLATVISLIINKPITAIASHLTRGWPWNWFNRKDIKPAYIETSILWLIFFGVRTSFVLFLFFQQDLTSFAWMNTLLGLPVTIGVLIITYVYGIWRLKNLKGPGVNEFLENKQPPYIGQTRGF